jgi:hypothetical protein
MSIISINGKISSGKDTVGRIIQYLTLCKKHNITDLPYDEFVNSAGWLPHWEIKKFAGKLKTVASLLTGVPVEMFEDQEFKKKTMSLDWIQPKHYNCENYDAIDGGNCSYCDCKEKEMTYREFLQRLGTEAMRDGLHTNVWVNALFSDYVPISDISKSNTYTDDRLQHGYKGTKIWRTYHNIKQRCSNKKHPRYKDYGSRGITICEEWSNNITSFINWAIENGYNESLTIDRIDNNKGYSPDNCRCVSYAIQATNTNLRKDNTSGYRGVTKDAWNWRAQIQIKGKQKFLGYFNSAEEASEVYENAFMEREGLYLKEEENNLIYPSWCITDMRFPNEMQAIEEREGITIRIVRYPKTVEVSRGPQDIETIPFDPTNHKHMSLWKGDSSRLHASETALDNAEFDYEIINDGTIEDLVEKVREILIKEEII